MFDVYLLIIRGAERVFANRELLDIASVVTSPRLPCVSIISACTTKQPPRVAVTTVLIVMITCVHLYHIYYTIVICNKIQFLRKARGSRMVLRVSSIGGFARFARGDPDCDWVPRQGNTSRVFGDARCNNT